MGVQVTLNDLTSGFAAYTLLDANNTLLETALNKALDRTASTDNAMAVDLDMGTNDILNVGSGSFASLSIGGNSITSTDAAVSTLPTQTGNSGKYLTTNGYSASWYDLISDFSSTSEGKGASLVGLTTIGHGTVDDAIRYITPLMVSAPSDGVTDAYTEFATMRDSTYPILVTPGTYLIGTSITFSSAVRFLPGAILKPASGVTITFNGGIESGLYQIFDISLGGSIAVDESVQPVGYVEWMGGKANDSGFDNIDMINACIVAFPLTIFGVGDYYYSTTIAHSTAFRRVSGISRSWTGSGGTRLMCTSDTADAYLLGLSSNPGSINSNLQHVEVTDLTIQRTATIVASAACSGIRHQWTLYSRIERVETIDNQFGFYISGNVQAHYKNNYARRHAAATTTTGDQFHGYYFNGNSGLAAAGGNASVYFTDNHASCDVSGIATNTGYDLDGPCADTFIFRGDVTSCSVGVSINGGGAQGDDGDVHIIGLICDGIGSYGLYAQNLGPYCAYNIKDNYFAPVGTSSGYTGMEFNSCNGSISTGGNQLIGWPYSGAKGLRIVGSSGIDCIDDMIVGNAGPVEVDSSSSCKITPIINQPAAIGSQAAVLVTGATNRSYFAPSVKGGSSVFSAGVNFQDDTMSLNEVNCTLINATAISGGSSNKLLNNSVQITATGAFGSNANLASGIMS